MSKPTTKDTIKPSMKVSGSTGVMKRKRMYLGIGMERCMNFKEQKNIKSITEQI